MSNIESRLDRLVWTRSCSPNGVYTKCGRKFTVPLTAMNKILDSEESLRLQFAVHKCKLEDDRNTNGQLGCSCSS
jgi:hypothetical protein